MVKYMIVILFSVLWTNFVAETAQSSHLSQKLVGENAIFAAETSSAISTSFTLKQTRIVITKSNSVEQISSVAASHSPRIIVTDAAEKGLVCLSTNQLRKYNISELHTLSSHGAQLQPNTGERLHHLAASQGSRAAEGGASVKKTCVTTPDDTTSPLASTSNTDAHGGGVSASTAASKISEFDKSVVGQGGGITASVTAINTAPSHVSDSQSGANGGAASSSNVTHSQSHHSSSSSQDSSSYSQTQQQSTETQHSTSSGQRSESSAPGGANTSGQLQHHQAPYECECVPVYLCDQNGYIVTYGEGLIDIRFNEDDARPTSHQCKPRFTCCRHRPDERTAIGWLPDSCGVKSPVRLDARVVEGNVAALGKWPWQVALMTEMNNTLTYICGGSLIAADVVLTAAHCVDRAKNSDKLVVRVGEWDTNFPDYVYPEVDVVVSQVVTHDKFNKRTLFNDIALLKLQEEVTLAQHINTICLPDDDILDKIDLHHCVATGWGKESFGVSHYSNILKEVSLEVVESRLCQTKLRDTRLGRWFKLHRSFLCAGSDDGQDTCTGDGGSPLVCRVRNEHDQVSYVQVGIVAWGIGCGQQGLPGVYADVIKQRDWISQKLALLSSPSNFHY